MISRVYDVLMPSNAGATANVDIPVENFNPSAAAAPVAVGADGFYSEWRNRPLRVPIKAGSTGFVPRFRNGFAFSIVQVVGTGAANLPRVQFSQSLVGNVFSTAAGAVTAGDDTFADPGGAPTIRIVNTAAIQGLKFRLFLQVMGAEDDDRTGSRDGG